MYSGMTKDQLILNVTKSQDKVAELTQIIRTLKTQVNQQEKELLNCRAKAQHLDSLTKPINENQVVKAAWDRFVMVLRMAGYDELN